MESGKQTDSESTVPKQVESEHRSPNLTLPRFSPHHPIDTVPPTSFSTHLDLNHPNLPLRPRKLGFALCTVVLILLTTQFASNIAQTKYFADLVEIESHHENPSVQQPLATCIVNNISKTLTLICKNAVTRRYSLRDLNLDTCGFGG